MPDDATTVPLAFRLASPPARTKARPLEGEYDPVTQQAKWDGDLDDPTMGAAVCTLYLADYPVLCHVYSSTHCTISGQRDVFTTGYICDYS